jgi:hypothetical protein
MWRSIALPTPLSANGPSGMHRLDLTMIGREPLQRTDPQERLVVPYRPKADVGRLQPVEVQGVCATRSRLRPGAGQMDVKKLDHALVAEVALDDSHQSGRPFAEIQTDPLPRIRSPLLVE